MKPARLVILLLIVVICGVTAVQYHRETHSLKAQMQAAEQHDLALVGSAAPDGAGSLPHLPHFAPQVSPPPSKKVPDSYPYPLHLAAADNDVAQINALLAQGMDVDTRDGDQRTALHRAAERDAVDAMKVLIAHHADVNSRSFTEQTPLLTAITPPYQPMFGNDARLMPIATLLIDNGANVNACDIHGDCALQSAYHNQLLDLTLLLINKGADVKPRMDSGRRDTILHMVAGQTPKQFSDQFTQQIGGQPGGRGNSWPPELKDQIAFAGLLIDKGADVNAPDGIHGSTPVMIALANKNYSLADFLISKGAALSPQDAALRGKHRQNPVDVAIDDGDLDTLKFLLDHGAKLSASPLAIPSLSIAIMKRNQPIVEFLVARGANVNEAAPDFAVRQTPLLYAVTSRNVPMVEILLAHGADPNARDASGTSAMQISTRGPHDNQIVDLLQKYGAK